MAKVDKVAITGTISPDMREAIEEYRWSHRMSLSDVVVSALRLWAKENGVNLPDEATEKPQEKTPAKK